VPLIQKRKNQMKKARSSFSSVEYLLSKHQFADKDRNFKYEFQYYGYYLASKLGDLKHQSLYMKMAKGYNRSVLEQALSFVIDYKARHKAKLFMWKVKELLKD